MVRSRAEMSIDFLRIVQKYRRIAKSRAKAITGISGNAANEVLDSLIRNKLVNVEGIDKKYAVTRLTITPLGIECIKQFDRILEMLGVNADESA